MCAPRTSISRRARRTSGSWATSSASLSSTCATIFGSVVRRRHDLRVSGRASIRRAGYRRRRWRARSDTFAGGCSPRSRSQRRSRSTSRRRTGSINSAAITAPIARPKRLSSSLGPNAYISPSWYPLKAEHGKSSGHGITSRCTCTAECISRRIANSSRVTSSTVTRRTRLGRSTPWTIGDALVGWHRAANERDCRALRSLDLAHRRQVEDEPEPAAGRCRRGD